MKKLNLLNIAFFLVLVSVSFTSAGASFSVNSFSCSPAEVSIGSVFSCTAQIKNNGDASGGVSTVTLYSDSNNWLEYSNYAQISGESLNPGQSASVTFTGLKAIKTGDNGFSKIMLDSVTDTYVADQNKKVNVIDVAVSVSNSASSALIGGTITATSDVTAGGDIDVELTFSSNSYCTIEGQTNPKTISGMTDGSKQSRTWTITQGSGTCSYTISASATGSLGIASIIDSTTSTITCTDCPVATSGSGGGAGGAGGGGGANVVSLGELGQNVIREMSSGDKIKFNISESEHSLTLTNISNLKAIIEVQSEKQTFTLNVGENVNVDLNNDSKSDINIKLDTINTISKKAKFILNNLAGGENLAGNENNKVSNGNEKPKGDKASIMNLENFVNSGFSWLLILLAITILVIIVVIIIIIRNNRINDSKNFKKVK